MEVNCEGCAGCCLDWRGLLSGEALEADADDSDDTPAASGARRVRGPFSAARAAADDPPRRQPLDDDPNFVPLTREEVRAFLEAGYASALTPRFFTARDEREALEIDGR